MPVTFRLLSRVILFLYCIIVNNCYSGTSNSRRTVFDFGKVIQGEIIKHTFKIRNDTPHTMTISKVETSCRCRVAAIFTEYEIEPHKTLKFEVAVDTGGQKGSMSKRLEVCLGPPHNEVLKYFLEARVRVPWECVPASANFGLRASVEGIQRTVRIENHSGSLLKIRKIKCAPSNFKVQLSTHSIRKDAYADLIVFPDEDMPAGCYEGGVKIITDHPTKKEVEIPLYLKLSGPVQAIPEVALLGIIHKDSAKMHRLERRILIRSSDQKELRIGKIEINRDSLQCKLRELLPGQRYELSIWPKPTIPVGNIDEKVRIHTGRVDQPVVEVRVFALVRNK